jgi:hypothetical protein
MPISGKKALALSHAQLCDVGAKWLKRSHSRNGPGCKSALVEPRSGYEGESPDVIGWRRAGFLDGTYLIEVKTSRADFLADAKKSHRQCSTPDVALGNWRFFLCPEGLIEPAEVPEKWGLLWADERGRIQSVINPFQTQHYAERREAVAARRFESNHDRELFILVGILSRIEAPEKLNELLRAADRTNAALLRELERERSRIHRLQERLRETLAERAPYSGVTP